jgi:hypothetical protein
MIKDQEKEFLAATKQHQFSTPSIANQFSPYGQRMIESINFLSVMASNSHNLVSNTRGATPAREALERWIEAKILSHFNLIIENADMARSLQRQVELQAEKSTPFYWVNVYRKLCNDIPDSQMDSTALLFDLDPITLEDPDGDDIFAVAPVRILVPMALDSQITYHNLRAYPRDMNWRDLHDSNRLARFHPHVDRDGTICAGEAAAAINNTLIANEYGELKTILQQLLSQYNPDSPYFDIRYTGMDACPYCAARDRDLISNNEDDRPMGCANCMRYSETEQQWVRRRVYHDYNQEETNAEQPVETQ